MSKVNSRKLDSLYRARQTANGLSGICEEANSEFAVSCEFSHNARKQHYRPATGVCTLK
ncbi:hypothetical protein M9458_051366, partial [Cirrhinus mrigala]